MATIKPAEIRAAHAELSSFIAQKEVVDVFEKAAKDRKVLSKIKRDPAAFLKEQGIKLPAKAEFTLVERRLVVIGKIRLCFWVCRQYRNYRLCVQMCIDLPIVVVR